MRVKQILKEKGLTSKDVAAKLGMTETGFSLMIGKDGNPPLKKLIALAEILNVDITELFIQQRPEYTICPCCGRKLYLSIES